MRHIFPILRRVLLAAVVTCAGSSRCQTQANAVTIGQRVQVQSAILGQARSLTISLPDGYSSASEGFPVVYLLDGESNFEYTAAVVHFLTAADRIPPMIVVGIDSGDFARRTHDLTPRSEAVLDNRFSPGGGGADTFLSFVADELIPYVERNYRTRPYRVLIGHSFGGLFAIHALVTRPKLFNAYIAIDPTVSWNNGAEVAAAERLLLRQTDLPADLFITAANEFGAATPGVRRLVAALDGKTPSGFRWRFAWMQEENHLSIPLRSVYSGLDTIFDDWHLTDPLRLYDLGGMQAIEDHFREGGRRFGYGDRTMPPFTVSFVVAGLVKHGRLDEASKLLLHDPKAEPPAWNQLDALARAYADRGNIDQAIRFYRMSLQSNPRNDWARQKLIEMGAKPE